jgi:hypothetical protein
MSGIREYPKMMYHDFHGQRVVDNAEEEQGLLKGDPGWRLTPQIVQAVRDAVQERSGSKSR